MFVSAHAGSYSASPKMRSSSQAKDATEARTGTKGQKMVKPKRCRAHGDCDFSVVDLGRWARVAMVLTPEEGRGSFQEQATEVLARMRSVIQSQAMPMHVAAQTVFLRDPEDQAECQRLIDAHFGAQKPVTTFVCEPPCCGAALALEAMAFGGPDLRLESFGSRAMAVSFDDLRWVFCGGITVGPHENGVYAQTTEALHEMDEALRQAGSGIEHAVRTWFYLGSITDPEGDSQRYKELNRARSDFYRDLRFHSDMVEEVASGVYPASTGIGMQGHSLSADCLTLQTGRGDVRLLALENPQQTPAYAYHHRYSPKSPKFSRAMTFALKDYVMTWVSGTASIVDSESLHPDDPTRQTEQTIENIERLISAENLAFHGVEGAGASLQDMARIRVYVKRPEDFAIVQSVCRKKFGPVPAIYLVADVCRPELLVEIEGVAFCRRY